MNSGPRRKVIDRLAESADRERAPVPAVEPVGAADEDRLDGRGQPGVADRADHARSPAAARSAAPPGPSSSSRELGRDVHLARTRQRGHAGRRGGIRGLRLHGQAGDADRAEVRAACAGRGSARSAARSVGTGARADWRSSCPWIICGTDAATSSSATPTPTPIAVRAARTRGPRPPVIARRSAEAEVARPVTHRVVVRPSRTMTSRSAYAATRGSWVTSTTAAAVSRARGGEQLA